jgi:hypothetical protein
MLYAFGFEQVSVLVSDLYFIDPNPLEGQETPERGVRLEVRLLERGDLRGSIYSAQPIGIGAPVWRADLLESTESEPGSLDRVHHHPQMRNWEPGHRVFEPELSAHPAAWVGERLSDLPSLLASADIEMDGAFARDAVSLRGSVGEIMDTVDRLLDRVKKGELARGPDSGPDSAPLISARVGWL